MLKLIYYCSAERIKQMTEKPIDIKKLAVRQKISESRIAVQHSRNKLTVWERINLLFDKDTFIELNASGSQPPAISNGALSNRNATDEIYTAGDGVITGCGKIKGKLVYAALQDFTVNGGTIGEIHSRKICKVLEKSMICGAPFIQVLDSGGIRIQEGLNALEAFAGVLRLNERATGKIPQISVIAGYCLDAAAYSPALTDFIFTIKNVSKLSITTPTNLKQMTGEVATAEELGGADALNTLNGISHFCYESEQDCFAAVRELVDYLPTNSAPPITRSNSTDSAFREIPELNAIVANERKKSYDMKHIIKLIADDGVIIELKKTFAPNLILAFIRLNGVQSAIIANQPKFSAGCIDAKAAVKLPQFIRFCDKFNIPIINLVDTYGMMPGVNEERAGLIARCAEIISAYSAATVPKIAVIIRKSLASGYLMFASPALGYDRILSWQTAEISALSAECAVEFLYKNDISRLEGVADAENFRKLKIDEYLKQCSAYNAAKSNIIDMIIEPQYTRVELINALEMLKGKKISR